MIIYKEPLFENDSYYFVIERKDKLAAKTNGYLVEKITALQDRRDCAQNYVLIAEQLNGGFVEDMVRQIKNMRMSSKSCVINFTAPLRQLLSASFDSSHIIALHFHLDSVRIILRASDMRRKLAYDLELLRRFFIMPVYGNLTPEVHVIASTAQNIINPLTLL